MQEQFVPYEIALKLKEKGFNEPCFGFYYSKYGTFQLDNTFRNNTQINVWKDLQERYSAPLWQQAIDWLCEVHHLHISIHFGYGWEFTIQSTKSKEVVYKDGTYNSPAEARKGGIEYALSLI